MSLVTITDSAKEHFIRMMKLNEVLAISLVVTNYGCNGVSFDYEFRPGGPGSIAFHFLDEEDIDYEFAIEKETIPYLIDGTIDLVTEGLNTRIEYTLPGALGSCGCGKSFNF